jgi:hypothetical protein
MTHVRPVFVTVTRLGGGGNVGRAARMDDGDIQQCGTVGQ